MFRVIKVISVSRHLFEQNRMTSSMFILDQQNLTNLRSVDEIILFSEGSQDVKIMLQDLQKVKSLPGHK